ncbi:DUF4294 domain-containing protein [Flavobacterium humi]|uniref:DUF4294 domain-containing protein n=1 Tax=Flavobacterium humi TaxID=2562683 RepID=A0A4Z0LBE9_9FLAO|nr:DUF4294 domain-containing protein [Flavobacterium humi]TGD58826.1 DUF4294 domain-containing protein [Flavobacterium humi]
MKSIQLVIVIFFMGLAASAQVVKKDTVEVEKPLVGYDTIANIPIELEEVYVSNRYNIKSAEERKQFLILQRRVMKTYPYAKIAADRLTALTNGMKLLKSDRDKKKYFKIVENYLTNEFEEQLKKLSRKDGQILVKLIHRQTGSSTFDLIKNLKSGWKAFWSNNTARLFDINLKTKFDPYNVSEDFLIEGILYKAFTDGRLPKQAAKIDMNYSELAKVWREKLRIMKEAREKEAQNQN